MNKQTNTGFSAHPITPPAHPRLRGWAGGVMGWAENPAERSDARGLNVAFSLENESPSGTPEEEFRKDHDLSGAKIILHPPPMTLFIVS
ncbi:hypothetical protein N9A70_00325 [Akkermansiaceae bacterium]|nr:hypothetical protein [Akkermansiaceae bacterium]MDB4466142.1 hypothetical protein [bacterium]